MLSSLQSGLSGLKAHQTYLDVIGNNLANTSTPGYKGSRITFADLFSNNLRSASKPTSASGGTNPTEVGAGVSVGTVDLKMTQGAVLTTGRPFDLGIQGEGFFILSDGTYNFFTRAGAFGIDAENYLVGLSSGMRVQTSTLTDIQLEASGVVPPTETSEITMTGSLPALVGGPLQEVTTSSAPFKDGLPAVVTGTNTDNPATFNLTDGNQMSVRVNGGAAQTITFSAADFTAIGANINAATAAQVAQVINAQSLTGVTASTVAATAPALGNVLVFTTENTGQVATLDLDNESGTPATTLGLTLSMVSGSETAATATTNLNDLVSNKGDYVNGDIITITGTNAAGLVVHADFTYGAANNGTTLGDLQSRIDSTFSDATATIDTNGNIVLTANSAGESNLSLFLHDADATTGTTLWNNFVISTNGTDEDTVTSSVSIFDASGLNHTLVTTFTRSSTSPLRWDVTAELQGETGVTVTNNISSVEFNANGSFNAVLGNGNTVEIYFSDTNSTQTVSFDMGTQGQFDGLTQVGQQGSVQISHQNGFAAGQLSTMSVEPNGQILGHYSNGQFSELGEIAIATFANPGGLAKKGDNLYQVSPNSGSAVLGAAQAGKGGKILAGTLEQSNVDIGEEFVSLIEAQRGFQANARIISTSDEVLVETVNLIR